MARWLSGCGYSRPASKPRRGPAAATPAWDEWTLVQSALDTPAGTHHSRSSHTYSASGHLGYSAESESCRPFSG